MNQKLFFSTLFFSLSLVTAFGEHRLPGGNFGIGFGALGAIAGLEQTTSVLESTIFEIENHNRHMAGQRVHSLIQRLRQVQAQLVNINPGFERGAWYQANAQECVSFCRSIGLEGAISREGAQCTSGESQAASAVGKIVYSYGTWGSGALLHSAATSSIGYCYRPGQKRDNDRTDLTVGCFCGR